MEKIQTIKQLLHTIKQALGWPRVEAIGKVQTMILDEPDMPDEAIQQIFSDLAYDLNFYEDDPRDRDAALGYYGDDKLVEIVDTAIKKIEDDTERFSFNTGVSGFTIAVNELTDLKCNKKQILEPLLILLAPYAPHIAEELWHQLGNKSTVLDARYPLFEEKYVTESSKEYPISVNGKTRTTMNISLDAAQLDVEKIVLENEVIKKWLEGKAPKKIIYVKGKMVNVVV